MGANLGILEVPQMSEGAKKKREHPFRVRNDSYTKLRTDAIELIDELQKSGMDHLAQKLQRAVAMVAGEAVALSIRRKEKVGKGQEFLILDDRLLPYIKNAKVTKKTKPPPSPIPDVFKQAFNDEEGVDKG